MTDWRYHVTRKTRTGLMKACPRCGLVLELALEPLASGDGYRWIYPVHALFAARCDGSLTEYDQWEGVPPSAIL